MRSPTELGDVDISFEVDRDEVVRTANLLVDEILAKAQEEALQRKETDSEKKAPEEETGLAGLIRRGERGISRARGLVARLLTSFRICK